ncbi:PQ-loop repeat-containing protein 1 [Tritrichomonas musculus]|uniref:PQ-loop repeat-containing protein 1 n=1 Tax=Tritrichomonas musculus TaxID=1915356 RepID=A0ABR2KZR2_9EUKA
MIKAPQVFLYILDGMIIISPTIGYIDTMRIMIKTRRSDHYNINTILIIYFAQGTKLLFYFYHKFATRILGQIIMLLSSATILTLIKFIYCDKKEKIEVLSPATQNKKGNRTENQIETISRKQKNVTYFFNIHSSATLFDFIISFSLYLIIIYLTFRFFFSLFGSKAVDFLGIISNLAEALTSFPTFIRVVIHQDALTTSPLLVLQYLCGDMLKIGVYSISKAPWSFFFGAFCQLSVDIITNKCFLRLYIKRSKKKLNSENSPLMFDVPPEAYVEMEENENL